MSIAEQPAPNAVPIPKTAPEPTPATQPKPSLYRVFWRWHFYAGVLVTPILLIVAITGAMYIFKDELESVLYPSTMFVQPQPSRVPLEQQIAAAKASVPEGYRAGSFRVSADPERATEVFFQGKDLPFKQVYVNQHTGTVQGELSDDGFFRVVLKLHRQLFLGSTGRVVVELMTGWVIVLLITGLYLWWPRKRSIAGVLYPRLRAKPYVVLRDLHTVAGFYLLPVALTIALTGLVYTQVWGAGYFYAAEKSGAFDSFRNPPKSTSAPTAKPFPFDDAITAARAHYPNADSVTLTVPAKPDGALVMFARGDTGPIVQGTIALDRSTGEVLMFAPLSETPALEQWARWNYPVHIGSVFGAPTKIIWLGACLILVALPVTGLWMWWTRRPAGKSGLPRRPDVRVPWALVGATGVPGVLLPVVGASMVLILLGEWVYRRVRRSRSAVAPV